jgi:hypothetical protein
MMKSKMGKKRWYPPKRKPPPPPKTTKFELCPFCKRPLEMYKEPIHSFVAKRCKPDTPDGFMNIELD